MEKKLEVSFDGAFNVLSEAVFVYNEKMEIKHFNSAAEKIKGVEDVRAFGDKLHLRVLSGQAQAVIAALVEAFPARTGERVEARLVPPTLEDVFISLSEAS